MILLLFTAMAVKAWKNYTFHFIDNYKDDEELKIKLL